MLNYTQGIIDLICVESYGELNIYYGDWVGLFRYQDESVNIICYRGCLRKWNIKEVEPICFLYVQFVTENNMENWFFNWMLRSTCSLTKLFTINFLFLLPGDGVGFLQRLQF